jgi:hypothetical protein
MEDKMAKVKLTGCAACPLSECKSTNFVAPETPANPALIVLISTHDKDGNENPDIGNLITMVKSKLGDRKAVILASQNCTGEYSLKSLKACREAYVLPTIEQYPGVPVLVLGEKAAHDVLGYKAAMIGKNGMAGKVLQLNMSNQDHYFTYGDMAHKDHIKVMLGSILGSMPEIEWQFGMPNADFWNTEFVVLDIEGGYDASPYLGGKLDCIGIANDKSDKVYCILPNEFGALATALHGYSGILAGHNISSDLVWLIASGFSLYRDLKIWDTMIHRKTRPDCPVRGFGLKYLLKSDYQLPGYEAKVHGCWHRGEIPALADLAWYNAVDVIGTKTLYEDQQKDNRNASTFFLAMDYIPCMVNLMSNGLYIDVKKMDELATQASATILNLKQDIQKIVGMPVVFNDEDEEEE